MSIGILGKVICLILLAGTCVGLTIQRSTLGENFGVKKERVLVSNEGNLFASDATNADESRRFVLGFDVMAESKIVRLFLKRTKGRNYDNDQEAKYFALSSCVLDEKRKCGKLSLPIPLRAVNVEIGQEQPTAMLIPNPGPPLAYGARPYYDVYSPTFSPTLLIKVSNEQQQKALQSLLK